MLEMGEMRQCYWPFPYCFRFQKIVPRDCTPSALLLAWEQELAVASGSLLRVTSLLTQQAQQLREDG